MTPREADRILSAIQAVMPQGATASLLRTGPEHALVRLGAESFRASWLARPSDVGQLFRDASKPDLIVTPRMSDKTRDLLAHQGVSWVDETGAAEVAIGGIVIARAGRAAPSRANEKWTPAAIAVAEAILTGVPATVSATMRATGMSDAGCARGLQLLAKQKHLTSKKARGRSSGRTVTNSRRLLTEYARVVASKPSKTSLPVGVTWRDPVNGLSDLGNTWSKRGLMWAVTGSTAAAVLAPLLTSVGTTEVYVDAKTIAELDAIVARSGLRVIEGGRLILKPFPTTTTEKLATDTSGLRVAPWPRVYADLWGVGVRGEEAAEHLREVMLDRR